MKWFVLMSFLFTFSAFAQVSQEEVSQMLEQMVKDNVISRQEAEKSKVKMRSMSPEQWSKINETASRMADRAPASVSSNGIEEVHNIDLEGAQFKQIQEEMQKIVPKQK